MDWFPISEARMALAGGSGGLVSWFTLRSPWREGVTQVIVGAICAVYVGPLAIPLLAPVLSGLIVDDASRSSFGGFLIGVGGLTVSGMFIDMWRARRGKVRLIPNKEPAEVIEEAVE